MTPQAPAVFEVYGDATLSPADYANDWSRHGTLWPLRILCLGIVWPLVLTSFMFQKTSLIFPWDLVFGKGGSMGAIAPQDPAMAMLVLAPLAAVIVVFFARRARRVVLRSALIGLAGLGTLATFSLLSFDGDMVLMGASILLFDPGLKLILLGLIAAGAFVAVGNRLRRHFTFARTPRIFSAVGGLGITAFFCVPIDGDFFLQILFSPGAWQGREWAASLVMLSIFAFGLLGLANVFSHRYREGVCRFTSLLGRLLLVAAPVAYLFGRAGMTSSPMFILDGGSMTPIVMATVKMVCLYYGCMLLFAQSLASGSATLLWNRVAPPDDPDEMMTLADEPMPEEEPVPAQA